ncbi:MAG: glycosyltransferase [Algicola sp.]|nr:glycosyltransferase [Algicola sp.]
MKILLVGEYNRSHKFLKDGLIKLGHDVNVIGLHDGFKKVDVDIPVKTYYDTGFLKKCKVLIYKLFNVDLHSVSVKKQILKNKNRLSGHDVVQFINEHSLLCKPKTEQQIFDFLTRINTKSFLLSAGCDYPSIAYAYDQKFRYSILTPYFEGRLKADDFSLGLKYIKPQFKALHEHIYQNIEGVISCDLDYTIPLENHPKHLGLIPHPINTDTILFSELQIEDKIVIFHGINRQNYYKKGNDIFEKALAILSEKYSDKIEIVNVESLPYSEYISTFDKAHIVLDQVYSFDQGYNALEAMAKGKVVFTGAEQEWLDYFNVKEDTIAINALPDAHAIAEKLEWLILHPNIIKEISKNARAFVEKEHHYITIAKRFLELWKAT